jgi:hypothetical protein
VAVKKPEFKNKKFYYRRAKWDGQGGQTLQKLLEDAHLALDTVGKRTFEVGSGGEIRGADYKSNIGLYLQVASYVPGEATSIIDKDKAAKFSNVTAQNAPQGKDYLDGDVFAYIEGNNVILCPSGARESALERYIWEVLRACDEKDIAKSFELDKVAKASKLKMIQDEGVKEVDLDTSLYEASLMHLDKSKPKVSGIYKVVADQIGAVFSKDKSLSQIQEKENLNVKISIRFDGREARKHLKESDFGVAGKKRLAKTAEQIISEFEKDGEDGFVIVTGANNRISSEEIRVSDSFRVKALGKSLSKDSAWSRLKEYHDRLSSDGVFKQ